MNRLVMKGSAWWYRALWGRNGSSTLNDRLNSPELSFQAILPSKRRDFSWSLNHGETGRSLQNRARKVTPCAGR